MKRYIIFSDMDGGTEVWKRLQTFQGTSGWKEFRWDYLDDINTVVRGIEIAEEQPVIYIYDIHEESWNFPKTPQGANTYLFNGIHYYELPFVDKSKKFDGALFVGFHSGPGEKGFSQYMFKPVFDYIKVNGKLWGELDFFSQLIAILDIPLLFVSGTLEVTEKINKEFPSLTTIGIDKEPELFRGNVSSRRYTQSIRDNYTKLVPKALRSEGIKTKIIKEGTIELKIKSPKKVWQISGLNSSINDRIIKYNFSSPKELLKIIFCHSYFQSNFSCNIMKTTLFYKNTRRFLKNKGIIKGM